MRIETGSAELSMIKWVEPASCLPPHRVTHPTKLVELIKSISANGWNGQALIGYPLDGELQLLSGSHRHEACRLLECRLPLVLHSYEFLRHLWGTDKWIDLMNNAPVARMNKAAAF